MTRTRKCSSARLQMVLPSLTAIALLVGCGSLARDDAQDSRMRDVTTVQGTQSAQRTQSARNARNPQDAREPQAGPEDSRQAQSAGEVSPYEPKRGQAGKDVVWIPTPDELVTRMLKLAQVRSKDFVVDLGAGDGKIVIAAAKEFGARGLGLEYDPKLVAHAQRNAGEAGVSRLAEFRQADIFATDFSRADVVTMYLLPDLNLKLRPTLMAMKPGTRLVSHQFTMGNWRPDETSWVKHRPAYLWIVPANAGGTWQATYRDGGRSATAELTLQQAFQDLKGSIEFGPIRTSLRRPRLHGSRIEFAFTDAAGALRQVTADVTGDRMRGRAVAPDGSSVEFSARREGAAPPVEGEAPASGEELIDAMRQLGG